MAHPPVTVVKVAAPIEPAIRDSRTEDLPDIHRIYAFAVENGTGSFEESAPSLDEMTVRRQTVLDRALPFLVAEYRGAVVGYAYAGPFRPRSAYRYTVEDSVYVAPEVRGLGIGRALLRELVARCTALGYRQMVAVIGDSGNGGSIGAHTACGFTHIGTLKSVGLKFGQWLDSVYMQRPLNEPDQPG
ncbi:Phosphinothricin N-acetyltransferase [uncultured Alphaproteobacteria bacterium]|uniref:Phosphinothricin N-acetyltransferase n=1 Tax=uncultured Alphaproteobacteria bacterium TaxID=91750 RepID=A0A212JIJ4_9PROT|nr:Phosphinothricin N-acetyltransferase [uncultured Alphaproteobacteria bacterium]